MQASRFFIPAFAALGIMGLSGWAVAQTTPTPAPTPVSPAPMTSTPATTPAPTATPPVLNPASETTAQRMERERMERERTQAPVSSSSSGTSMNTPMRRDANGNPVARADRN